MTPAKQLTKLIGPRCKTKDTDDFPELKDGERCGTCEIWDAIDQYTASILASIPLPEKNDPRGSYNGLHAGEIGFNQGVDACAAAIAKAAEGLREINEKEDKQ